MANVTPTQLIPGIASDGTNITIPIASLAGLSAAEAEPATGDGRAVVQAINERVYTAIQGLATTDRPTKMTIVKTAPTTIPGSNDTVRQGYTTTFDLQLAASSLNIVAEV